MANGRAVLIVRIAVAAACAAAIVLLTALWVRSFTISEELFCRATGMRGLGLWSGTGHIALTLHSGSEGLVGIHYIGPFDANAAWQATQRRQEGMAGLLGFRAGRDIGGQLQLMTPYWFAILLFATVGVGVWCLAAFASHSNAGGDIDCDCYECLSSTYVRLSERNAA